MRVRRRKRDASFNLDLKYSFATRKIMGMHNNIIERPASVGLLKCNPLNRCSGKSTRRRTAQH